jgi:ApaG protein
MHTFASPLTQGITRGTLSPVSTAVTRGIRVSVKSIYIAERSSPARGQYAFAYTVTIANEGRETAQLRTRHWIITDGDGNVHEVKGEGVVGAQPVLQPGQSFEYTSWCPLPTPHGSMHGSYQMLTADGEEFDAEIAPFSLAMPYSLN